MILRRQIIILQSLVDELQSSLDSMDALSDIEFNDEMRKIEYTYSGCKSIQFPYIGGE